VRVGIRPHTFLNSLVDHVWSVSRLGRFTPLKIVHLSIIGVLMGLSDGLFVVALRRKVPLARIDSDHLIVII
jgi:hypothetical protein